MASASRLFHSLRLPSATLLRNTIAALPLTILVCDSFFSLCRVRGSSMEPAVSDGDVLVVRKSDGIWQRWTRKLRNRGNDSLTDMTHISDQELNTEDDVWSVERAHVLEYEKRFCRSRSTTGWVRKPPLPFIGNIVVFQDPETYPPKWNVKRVIGLGGQTVLVKRPSFSGKRPRNTWSTEEQVTGMVVATSAVPPYSVWVEGDNPINSRDSRHANHGPVSKKMLVGVAEYRVWPPWKIGKLVNTRQALFDQNGYVRRREDGADPKATAKYRSTAYWP